MCKVAYAKRERDQDESERRRKDHGDVRGGWSKKAGLEEKEEEEEDEEEEIKADDAIAGYIICTLKKAKTKEKRKQNKKKKNKNVKEKGDVNADGGIIGNRSNGSSADDNDVDEEEEEEELRSRPLVCISSLAISSLHRGSGLGQDLLCAAANDAHDKWGVQRAMLQVEKTNYSARRLYERLGFFFAGEESNYYGEGRDAYIMIAILPLLSR